MFSRSSLFSARENGRLREIIAAISFPRALASTEPRYEDFAFPARGVLALGDFRARIRDETAYQALRARYNASVEALPGR